MSYSKYIYINLPFVLDLYVSWFLLNNEVPHNEISKLTL